MFCNSTIDWPVKLFEVKRPWKLFGCQDLIILLYHPLHRYSSCQIPKEGLRRWLADRKQGNIIWSWFWFWIQTSVLNKVHLVRNLLQQRTFLALLLIMMFAKFANHFLVLCICEQVAQVMSHLLSQQIELKALLLVQDHFLTFNLLFQLNLS